MKYTREDIQVLGGTEPLIRRRPEMFFGSSGPNPERIMCELVLTALVFGATRTETLVRDGWYVVRADLDWLAVGSSLAYRSQLWTQLRACPELGVNACRYEVMVKLFSSAAVTWAPGEVEYIVGGREAVAGIVDAYEADWCRRGVAFKFSYGH